MMAHKSVVFATSHPRRDTATMQSSQRKTIQMRFACETCLPASECGKLLPDYQVIITFNSIIYGKVDANKADAVRHLFRYENGIYSPIRLIQIALNN